MIKYLLPLLLTFAVQVSYALTISEIDLATSKVEIVNNTAGTVNMTGYRWCNKVNGTPAYSAVSAVTIDTANSDGTDLIIAPGEILVFTLTSAFLPAAGGELGLYISTSYTSRSAMVDYVNYGTSTGVRDSVADDAPAIWVLNTAISLSGAGPGDTIQLKLGAAGDSVNDYEIAPSTIGIAQFIVPELNITDFGFVDPTTLFIDYTYTGSMTVTPKETSDLGSAFTAVSTRATVLEPSANRFEFDAPAGTKYFFQLEETTSP
ncbi:MAG: hypothetical protein ACSHX8_03420 [Opitutaceae bacterium]